MSDPAEYTVGWICALLVEYIAAQELLDEEHLGPRFVSPNDANQYTLGKMGEHRVVIAVLPDREYGTASAANVATNMLNSFHNIRIGLMVGIAGGAPSDKNDIRLGDIVVSASRDDKGSVFQYDFGKSIQDQRFQHTRFLNQPPTILRTAIAGIQARYTRKGHQLQGVVDSILAKNSRLRRDYQRPPADTDRLVKAEVSHGLGDCDSSCVDNPSNLVLRSERAEDENNPAIHYGLVASGNRLMKDALIRDRLAAEKNVLCFEMEAAGLMNTFPCLVIRGICDYSDSHKNKRWQGYAAMVAAAYTKDLLRSIPLNRIEHEERISDLIAEKLEGTKQQLDQLNSEQARYHSEQKYSALTNQQHLCLQTFKVSTYEEQKNINPRKAEGTCVWALQSVEYIRWSDSSCNDLLWVSADPGCGKSVLARSIVDDGLEASGSVRTFCYFFFKNNEEQNHLAVALCSVLHQLFSRRPQLLRYAIPSWEKNGKKLQQEVDELWRIFTMAALSDTSCKTICIFDALDECCDNNQGRLIEKLQSSHRSQHPLEQDTWLEFLVTSRPYSHIQDRFRVVTDSFPHLHLKGEEENDQINEEINRVVKIKVKDLAKSAQLTRDIQRQLEAKLLRMKHRTYLWLYLAMEDIRDTFADSLRPAEESIQLIPPSVEAAYQNILSRVRPAQQAKVNMILQIIAAARRPLTISEMAVALSLAMPPRGPRTLQTELETNGLGTKLRRLCGLFVYIHNSKVYLIHETAKEFLLGDLPCHTTLPSCHHWGNSITNRDAHATLARVCVIHLESFNDESTISDPDGETSQCLQNEVFLDYSAQNWNFHFSLAEFSQDDDISFRAMRLCDPNLQVFSIWWSFLRTTDPITHSNMPVPPTSLIISSWFGHQGIVGLILKRGIKSHFELELPLSIAVVRGNQAVTELLLENNAYHELGTAGCTSPLEYVVRNGNMALLELLLQCGANVNPKTSVHPLQIAARSGNLAVVNLLLNKGADPKSLDRVGPPRDMLTPLSIAAAREHTAIVKLLLKNGAETDPKKCKHPLFCAAENGYVAVVEALLQKGVSPDLEYNGQTPLSRAAESGHSEVISLLIDKGDAQADSQDSNGRTPLSWAACNGHVEAVKLLLSTQSVNPDSKDHGRIHLSNAAKAGYREIIKIFRERGVIIKATSNGRTPLSYAAGNGNEEVVKLLLENEAVDPNSEDSKGLTPLAYARKSNHGKVVELLLSRGGREGF